MNVLLVYPQYPDTYWSFKYALKFIAKKAVNFPLGVATVAALLPKDWNKQIVDLNVSKLTDKMIEWADFVFISAMQIQIISVTQVIERCKKLKTKIVAGGPLFTEEYEQFPEIDHMVLNEAEITLPHFIADVNNNCPQKIYQTSSFADITKSPIPAYHLLKHSEYAGATLQYSRGCPFDCEFCDITALFGRKVRTKSSTQVISELNMLLKIGWKGSVFFVDDNFIGHKSKLKNDLLPAMIEWMELHKHPYIFTTEASINLADDQDLMYLMSKAGFTKVFIGIETPEEKCLMECNKLQNNNRDLINSVRKIQQYGMEVTAGFIVGFDNDPPNIFQRQIDFIQQSGIVTAMVGLLNAPRFSKLYLRLQSEGRITDRITGCNTDYSLNFLPRMDKAALLKGYQDIIVSIYSSKSYYTRVKSFLKQYKKNKADKISIQKITAFVKSIYYLGIVKKHRRYYWNLFFWSLIFRPHAFTMAITFSIYGYHFRKIFKGLK